MDFDCCQYCYIVTANKINIVYFESQQIDRKIEIQYLL